MKVSEQITELTAPKKDDRAERARILSMMPGDMDAPVISNTHGRDDVAAWISFSDRTYGQGGYDPADILRGLELAGWKLRPASLVKRDNYRRSPEPGLVEELPQDRPSGYGRYELTDCEPIAPVWIRPCQHTSPEAICFMIAPDGQTYRVSVDIPRSSVSITARRIESRGHWRYDRGSARLIHPEAWHNVGDYMQPCSRSGAWVDTEQGISGALYFTLTAEDQSEFNRAASDIVSDLLPKS